MTPVSSYTITWTTMNKASWTATTAATNYNFIPAQWAVPSKVKHSRGWNGKQAVRCGGCARWAKVVRSGFIYNFGDKTPWYETECKRCGKDQGFVGKRF